MIEISDYREIVKEAVGDGVECDPDSLVETHECNLKSCDLDACIVNGTTYQDKSIVSEKLCHIWYV